MSLKRISVAIAVFVALAVPTAVAAQPIVNTTTPGTTTPGTSPGTTPGTTPGTAPTRVICLDGVKTVEVTRENENTIGGSYTLGPCPVKNTPRYTG